MDASGSSYVSPQTSSVSLKHILLSEVLSVTSVMRKNSRWAMSTNTYGSFSDSALASSFGLRRTRQYPEPYISDQGSKEQELMRGFQELRRLVKDIDGMRLNQSYQAGVVNCATQPKTLGLYRSQPCSDLSFL
jgi:hypothetical protein